MLIAAVAATESLINWRRVVVLIFTNYHVDRNRDMSDC
jgi:hypothetical protein